VKNKILVSGEGVTVNDVIDVARKSFKVLLDSKAVFKIEKSRRAVEKITRRKQAIYGINTGFGSFKNKQINENDLDLLQENLILSHSTSVGKPFSEEIIRAALFIRANTLAKGNSGIRRKVIELLIEMLNKKIHPVVPRKGSVGSSGDLSPMSHLCLALIGKSEVFYQGKRISAKEAFQQAKIKPIRLKAKEGLALINGTTFMTAIGALAVYDAEKLCEEADKNGALALEALRGSSKAFSELIHLTRPHRGQILSAKMIRKFVKNSTMVEDTHVQDQYSLRCIPQVHGAARDAVDYVRDKIEIEINSSTDNPLVFCDKQIITILSGGNFHGTPISIAMDFLAIAVAGLANISDRRLASMLDSNHNNGLPGFLTSNGGLNSGLMIWQYTTASLVSENKVLSHPASVDSIPTSANIEDHVSMGTIAARKAMEVINNTYFVLAIERMAVCQAIDFRLMQKLSLGEKTRGFYNEVRKIVSFSENDQLLGSYVNLIVKKLKD